MINQEVIVQIMTVPWQRSVRAIGRYKRSAQLMPPIIIGSSTPSLQMNHAHHRCALQALRSALAHHSPTIARPRHTHRNQTGRGSSYGRPTGSDCHLGWACPQVRQPSRRAWRHHVRVVRDRRVDGRSSGSGEMILAWLSHGVTFFAQYTHLISEIVEQRERGNRFFRGSEGERQKGGDTNRRSWYACRSAGTCESDDTRENSAPMTAASSTAIAAPCARYG
jgi:hypothetical protein